MKHELSIMRYMYLLVRNDFTLTIVNSHYAKSSCGIFILYSSFFLYLSMYFFYERHLSKKWVLVPIIIISTVSMGTPIIYFTSALYMY